MNYKARHGHSGILMPPPKEPLPVPAPPPPDRTKHGRRGCWRPAPLTGELPPLALHDPNQPTHHKEIWAALSRAVELSLASGTEHGGMRLDSGRNTAGIIGMLVGLEQRYPHCVVRACAMGRTSAHTPKPWRWKVVCPGCGTCADYTVEVVTSEAR
jgi:hypothetical protein